MACKVTDLNFEREVLQSPIPVAVPTLIIFKNGQPVKMIVGVVFKEAILEALNKI
jgi:thiol-disulfide isomerase/thioredoxin